jgi:hypothetical protein
MQRSPSEKNSERPSRRDLKNRKTLKDKDFSDTKNDKDLKLSSESSLITSPVTDRDHNRSPLMGQTKKASLTNNVFEFKPGDQVIAIYPVPRPFIGVVTGASKIEGKVYVSWNGRVTQHDPEEIQLAAQTPFHIISSKNTEQRQKRVLAFAQAVRNVADEKVAIIDEEYSARLASALEAEGYDATLEETATEFAESYTKSLIASMSRTHFDPPVPTPGEVVVVLNKGGRSAGVTGILVACEGHEALVDVNTSWTSKADGSHMLKVPMVALVPVDSYVNRSINRGASIEDETTERTKEARSCLLGHELFLNMVKKKRFDVFKQPGCETWVEVNLTDFQQDGCKHLVVSSYGCCGDKHYKLFEEDFTVPNPCHPEDVDNQMYKAQKLMDNARATALRFVRDYYMRDHVEEVDKKWQENAEVRDLLHKPA